MLAGFFARAARLSFSGRAVAGCEAGGISAEPGRAEEIPGGSDRSFGLTKIRRLD
jgi:hypothetical protein